MNNIKKRRNKRNENNSKTLVRIGVMKIKLFIQTLNLVRIV